MSSLPGLFTVAVNCVCLLVSLFVVLILAYSWSSLDRCVCGERLYDIYVQYVCVNPAFLLVKTALLLGKQADAVVPSAGH